MRIVAAQMGFWCACSRRRRPRQAVRDEQASATAAPGGSGLRLPNWRAAPGEVAAGTPHVALLAALQPGRHPKCGEKLTAKMGTGGLGAPTMLCFSGASCAKSAAGQSGGGGGGHMGRKRGSSTTTRKPPKSCTGC